MYNPVAVLFYDFIACDTYTHIHIQISYALDSHWPWSEAPNSILNAMILYDLLETTIQRQQEENTKSKQTYK